MNAPSLCVGVAIWLVAAAARAQSLVEVVPEDPCEQARALDRDDDSPAAQHLRRVCRLERFDDRLAAERSQEIAAAEEARTVRIERWIDRTQPARTTRPFSVDAFLGDGLATYGLSAAWAFVRDAEVAAWIGRRSITCDNVNAPLSADCTRTAYGFRGRWFMLRTKIAPFLAAGLSFTTSHLQIVKGGNGGGMLVSGSGRANSYNGGGGIQLAVSGFRLSVEYVYEHAFYTGASGNDAKRTPNADLNAVWSHSLNDDRHGVRFQAGYAF